MVMKRAVGYCQSSDCEDFAKGVFLLNCGNSFTCPRCRNGGNVKPERGFYVGNGEQWKEVRVEFNYNPITDSFREIGVVRDESIQGVQTVYTLESPLIKTETRALKVAEAILANLNRYHGMVNGDGMVETREKVLSWDDDLETFSKKLQGVAKDWSDSNLTQEAS
jgi:hypothetical protein